MTDKRNIRNLPPPPDVFSAAIRMGAEDIRRYERKKRRIVRISAAVACAVVCLTALLTIALRQPVQDTVLTQTGEVAVKDVWVHPDDPCWHADGSCVNKSAEAVVVPIETAQEFGKEVCEECGKE